MLNGEIVDISDALDIGVDNIEDVTVIKNDPKYPNGLVKIKIKISTKPPGHRLRNSRPSTFLPSISVLAATR